MATATARAIAMQKNLRQEAIVDGMGSCDEFYGGSGRTAILNFR
jgi:hypothetical protein